MRNKLRNFVAAAMLAAALFAGAPATVRADYYIPPQVIDYEIIDLEFGGWIIEITTYANGSVKYQLTQLAH
jgi:hypothetical protein